MSLGRILPATHLAVCINQIEPILLSQYLRLLKRRKVHVMNLVPTQGLVHQKTKEHKNLVLYSMCVL
jgi:hypothetical protein